MSFWSQYESKIHSDKILSNIDKFHYLSQCIELNSRARDVFDSYPMSSANYEKVIQALKERFGNEEMLIELYIRKLLELVINNVNKRDKLSLSSMYDKLETHLRNLESLKVNINQNSPLLYPLVESSLPEDVLRARQRSNFMSLNSETNSSKLSCLMRFLNNEVKSEERIYMAREGFENIHLGSQERKISFTKNRKFDKKIPTVTSLFTAEKVCCIFCDKSHESKECIKARSL